MTNSSETVSTLAFGLGGSAINITPATSGTTTVTATAITRAVGATAVITGTGLGGTAGNNVANLVDTNAFPAGFIVGGLGGAGTTTISIAPSILGDTTVGGSGTGFVTWAQGGTGVRLLTGGEYAASLAAGATTNVMLASGAAALGGNITVNSLTLNSGAAVTGTAGQALTVTSGGILATANSSINVGNLYFGAGAAGTVEGIVHVLSGATLNVTGAIGNGQANSGTVGGLTKADGGTLILNTAETYLGNTTINGGILRLNGGTNTLAAPIQAAPGSVALQILTVNGGGTLDLFGNSQLALESE